MPVVLAVYEEVAALCDSLILAQRGIDDGASAKGLALLGARHHYLWAVIFRQRYQLFIKRTSHIHRRADALAQYVGWYRGGQTLLAIARHPDVNFSPYLFARIMLEALQDIPRGDVYTYIKDTSLIPDKHLAAQVEECIAADTMCGPAVDAIKAGSGRGREETLQVQLEQRGIPFTVEDDLRREGYSKTPDVRLDVPIGVYLVDDDGMEEADEAEEGGEGGAAAASAAAGGAATGITSASSADSAAPTTSSTTATAATSPRSGAAAAPAAATAVATTGSGAPGSVHIVHWIDSKAMFGDPTTHAENMEQLLGYVNRFGPGLVIYWLDFVDSIRTTTPPEIAVAASLPSTWILPGMTEPRTFKKLKTPLMLPAATAETALSSSTVALASGATAAVEAGTPVAVGAS